MKIVCISDMHGNLLSIPECQILLIAGDICPTSNHSPVFQSNWLDTTFREWLKLVPARHIIGTTGNHDLIFQDFPHLVPEELPWHYLQDSSIVLDGLKFYGTPWQNYFCNWAFNAPEKDVEEHFLAEKFNQIPDDTDVLICHSPPYGYGDQVKQNVAWATDEHLGSKALMSRIKQIKPKLVCYGHIHTGNSINVLDDIKMVNASLLNEDYRVVNEPVIIEL